MLSGASNQGLQGGQVNPCRRGVSDDVLLEEYCLTTTPKTQNETSTLQIGYQVRDNGLLHPSMAGNRKEIVTSL